MWGKNVLPRSIRRLLYILLAWHSMHVLRLDISIKDRISSFIMNSVYQGILNFWALGRFGKIFPWLMKGIIAVKVQNFWKINRLFSKFWFVVTVILNLSKHYIWNYFEWFTRCLQLSTKKKFDYNFNNFKEDKVVILYIYI